MGSLGARAYDAFFIPPELDSDRAIALGIKWLVERSGEPLILLHAKKMIGNNRLLGQVVRQYRLRVEAPQTVWRSGRWAGGAVLAPWANPDVIRCIDDDLSHLAEAVCVIGWRPDDPNHASWITARNAIDLTTGLGLGRVPTAMIDDPVVRIALDHAERFVNHNNALVQAEDKAYLARRRPQSRLRTRGTNGINQLGSAATTLVGGEAPARSFEAVASASFSRGFGRLTGPPRQEVSAKTSVRDVLQGKLGSIRRAPLPSGSPSWDRISEMTMSEVRAAGFGNLWSSRFDLLSNTEAVGR